VASACAEESGTAAASSRAAMVKSRVRYIEAQVVTVLVTEVLEI
jgi:hypothetical protein